MKFKSIFSIAIAFILFAFASCKKDLLQANTTPTAITASAYDPNLLLTQVQLMYTGSTDFGAENWYVEWGELAGFIQHTSSTNTAYYSGDKYLNNVGGFGVYFNHSYIYQVQPVVELYMLTRNNPKYRNLHQMARIMKAMVFERITDLYGDVPYSQAGLGYYSRIYTPVYDKQQDIYPDLLKEVSQAIDSLDVKAERPTGDVFYFVNQATQIDEWKKFGNSLLLRMAMRLTKVDPETAKKYVTKVQGLTMASNADNAIVQHQAGNNLTQNRDAWAIFGQDSTDVKLCNVYVDFLKNNKDPRLHIISWVYSTKDTVSADQLGMPQGYILGGLVDSTNIVHAPNYPKNTGLSGYSRLNDNILNNAAPNLILTYAESEFLLADAAVRWQIGDAKIHYENGVKAAITQLNAYGGDALAITDNDANVYLANHPYNPADALNQINTQFWASTIMNEYEAWCNWRRTSSKANPNGYPALKPTHYPGNVTGGSNAIIPRRLEYPQDERISNQANYNAAIANLTGGDHLTSRMWWDKEPGQ